MRAWLRILSFIACGLSALALIIYAHVGHAEDKGILADLISKALSSPGMQVSVGSVDGALSSDATIHDITIADKDGVWLRLDQARLIWTRTALFSRRLEVNTLEIGKLEISRKPVPSGEAPPPSADNSGPLLPELPVKVEIQKFALHELSLGEPILGTAAKLSADGKASLGDPSEGLNLDFHTRRLDAPGAIDLSLAYVPKTKNLNLQLKADEPASGLIARVANLPGLPPVDLDVEGNGPLDNFNSKLQFNAGPDIGADGALQMQRQGAGRQLGLNLNARIEGLVPGPVAPIFSGTTQMTGTVGIGDDNSVSLDNVALVAKLARLDIGGHVGADKSLDMKVSIRAVPQADGTARVQNVSVGTFNVDLLAKGTLTQPNLALAVKLVDAQLPAGRIGNFEGNVAVAPNGALNDTQTQLALSVDAQAQDVRLSDPALASAVGDGFALTVRGTSGLDGQGNYPTVHAEGQTFAFNYAGQLGPKTIAGQADLTLADLKRFAALSGVKLEGNANLHVNVSGSPQDQQINAALSGDLNKFGTGIVPLDGLTAGHVALSGAVKQIPDGGFGFDNLQINGTHVSVVLDGVASRKAANLKGQINIPDLKYADARLTGAAAIEGNLTGTLDKPDADGHIILNNVAASGRTIPHLALNGTAKDLTGALQAQVAVEGQVDRRPAQGGFNLSRLPDGGWRLANSDIAIGSVSIKGGIDLSAQNLANGHLVLAAGDLDDLSALALQELSGSFNADVTLQGGADGQAVALVATGSSIRAATMSLNKLNANLHVSDAYRNPLVDGTLEVDAASVGTNTISKVRFESKSANSGSDFSLSAAALGFDLNGRGRLSVGAQKRLDLQAFSAKRGGKQIALTGPATFTLIDQGVDIKGLSIGADGGRITVEGQAGNRLNLNVAIKAVPMSVADIAAPNLGLSGTLDGDARIGGAPAALAGDWRIHLANFSAPQLKQNGLPALDIAGSGRLSGDNTSVDAKINAGAAGTIAINGRAPLAATGSFDLRVKGTLDAAVANRKLSVNGQNVSGKLTIDANVTGTIAAPKVSGSAVMSGGAFNDPTNGIALSNIDAKISATGDTIRIEKISAATKNNGTLSIDGQVKLAPDAGFPGQINIHGQHAQLVSNDLATAVANLNLQLSGALAQSPKISGRVDILSLDVTVPERLPIGLGPLPDTKHIGATGSAAQRLAIKRREAKHGKAQPPFDADISIDVNAPSHIFVRGRGIDAELGGDLKLTGRLANLSAVGGFEMRRGVLNVLGQRLDFTRGKLTFAGGLIPELDFVAETKTSDITAQINVTGEADQPSFSFSSSPELPQDEILSRILFEKASGGLSPVQALQLASALAEFTGNGGPGVFERTRKALGVDSLDVQTGNSGAPAVGASRYISRNISVGVTTGVKPSDSGVSVKMDVTKHIKLQGGAGADGSTSVGVGTEWEY
ncbi:translocation/assembly module TamB domain-containing protein [Methylovirgula sp. 4M-Z18]|uniref:translocation/assembly module TamB domain-containing protein n=1 Tax=Methylovirgula sp. 4M-Z18 TaxID=2293567 RepID=UPI000E2EB3A3|nr:translocation/assembly module TamB domain-containing protein [Methylovirgula sp. 4M-Z18]RFB79339.1 hypothetical protein DYH55_12320 [Methylovirgula sp. 4M-Z18]